MDPLTYTRVAELLAEGSRLGRLEHRIANNGIGQLVTLGLPDDGVHEIPWARDAVLDRRGQAPRCRAAVRRLRSKAIIASPGIGLSAAAVRKSSWMPGGYQILDDGASRAAAPAGVRCIGAGCSSAKEATAVPGSWDVAGLRGTGSFDWTVKDVFLPERRSCPHVGVPLDNQWSRGPGVTSHLPSQCWVGPHHSSVITGIARAGIDALIALALEKSPRGRDFRLCDNPQVQDDVGRGGLISNAGRTYYRSAMITELWGYDRGVVSRPRWSNGRAAGWPPPTSRVLRAPRDGVGRRHGGSTSFKRAVKHGGC